MSHHKIFASGLYKLSIALLVFSCLGVIFGIIGLTGSNTDGTNEGKSGNALSLIGSILQIVVCALGIHGAKTYSFPALVAGAIICGIVVAWDAVLIILWGIALSLVVAAGAAGAGSGTGAAVGLGLAIAVILLILPIVFFVLYLIEFILLIRHAKRARGGVHTETTYVKV